LDNKSVIDSEMENRHNQKPALFLDRDGVVINHIDYLSKCEDVEIIPDVANLINRARQKGYLVILVTNQSGIGRKYFSFEDLQSINNEMNRQLNKLNAYFDGIYYSPYFENSTIAEAVVRKNFRKPRPGMLLHAAKKLRVNLSNSIMVGDRYTDLVAGVLADLKAVYLFNSKYIIDEQIAILNWFSQFENEFRTDCKTIINLNNVDF
jgi:D-glycero-D-manno-heptose 1,7-bisphosphate phosphatase